MTDAIIFDIDGTLALLDHRTHFVRDGKRDWKSFFDAMVDDAPNPAIVWLSRILARASLDFNNLHSAQNENFKLFIVTGRSSSHRSETEEWLKVQCPELWAAAGYTVIMREEGDFRSDVEVKREILKNITNQGFDVQLTIDDRQSVVDMWRGEGVTCLQCAPGDFDTKKQKYDPGSLVMLVGPSGAGKTRWLDSMRGLSGWAYISSDETRQLLCGDFKDQSKNAQVFSLVHELIRTNIEHGVNVVYDATNIRNKDRKAILDLMPADTLVEYIVHDRPMNRKVRDGGWRNEVVMKDGKSLMQRHSDTFKSNLKAILAGDNDPRVKVFDQRETK